MPRRWRRKHRQRLDTNQELVGQGLSNIVSGLFSGYPVSGSFSRSAVNIDAGARTGFSSIVTGAVVGIALLFLTPLLYHLPTATLGSVIILAVVNLVKVQPVIHAWKAEHQDGVISVITFLLTLYLAPHLEWGIVTGVGLSILLFFIRTMRPRVAELSRFQDGTLRDISVHPVAHQRQDRGGAVRRLALFRQRRLFRGQDTGGGRLKADADSTSSSTAKGSISWTPPVKRCCITWPNAWRATVFTFW